MARDDTTPAQIELRNVSKTFSDSEGRVAWTAVEDVSFAVRPGEIVGLLGPSGCGKSTLLSIVAGLDGVFAGDCRIEGRPVAERLNTGFRVAYVFQESRLLPWKTVRQNIEFVLRAAGIERAEWRARIDRVLARVELLDFADFYPRELSGGMQQRASIARAFAIEPDVLLLDEPFSALDELTARRLRQALLELWADFRTTVLFVSHNALESTFLGDRILIMSPGPAGRIRDTIDLSHLPRPRSYDDTVLFEASKRVVASMRQHVGDLD